MLFVPLFRRACISVLVGVLGIGLTCFAPSGGAVRAEGATVSVSSLSTSAVARPLSASTCSYSVCIYVTGTGLNVSNWSTSGYISKSMCSTAKFLVNGAEWASSHVCGSADTELEADWVDPGNFANGTQLCNTWTGISGEPCATVHS